MCGNYSDMHWECIRIGKAEHGGKSLLNVDFYNEARGVHICLDIEPEFVSRSLFVGAICSNVWLQSMLYNAVYEYYPAEGGEDREDETF